MGLEMVMNYKEDKTQLKKIMKLKKLIATTLNGKSDHSTQIAIAVIAGVTVGAVISLLFAPDRGSQTRRGITGKALALGTSLKGLFAPSKNNNMTEDPHKAEPPYGSHNNQKRAKSDIKELIHEAHVTNPIR